MKGTNKPSAYAFFEYLIGLILILVSGIAYKVVFKTKIRDPKTADLQTGRRHLSGEEIDMLNKYYNLPAWRRVATFLQLW